MSARGGSGAQLAQSAGAPVAGVRGGGLPSALAATLVVFRHELLGTLRNPVFAAVGIAQPLLYLFLFGPLLTGIAELGSAPGVVGDPAAAGDPARAYGVFVPALFIQLSLFGGAFVGITLVTEFREGVLERVLATPAPRAAILFGKVLRDCAVLTVQALLVAGAAVLLGFRIPIVGLVGCLGLVALVTAALSSVSYAVALASKDEQALANVFNALLLPAVLLAGVMLPMALAPAWLRAVSAANPLTYVVEGARAAAAGNFADGTLLLGYASAAAMAGACVAFACWVFRRQD